jgi:hypothetical protein
MYEQEMRVVYGYWKNYSSQYLVFSSI